LNIFGWLADHAGCGWYRIMLPLAAAQELGATTRYSGRLTEADWDVDVIVAQRVYKPGPTGLLQRIARHPNRPLLVYEIDDDLLGVPLDNPSIRVFGLPEVKANIRSNIEIADLVTVSTAPLAERIAKINPRVAVLPNCIPSEMLAWRHARFADRFTVGWQGSPTHTADWSVAAKAVGGWARSTARTLEGARLEFHTHGGVPDTFPQVPRHRHSDWDEKMARFYMTIDWDVALAPLQNNQFNRSKSDIRILEAAMLGIPVIASDVPAYHDSVRDGQTGYLVTHPRQWREALQSMWSGAAAQMGGAAREWAATRVIENHAQRWLDAYEKARSGT